MKPETSNPNLIKILSEQFQVAWNSGDQPSVIFYLCLVHEFDQLEFLKLILPIDIRHRQLAGETISVDDYKPVGSEAVYIAKKLLADQEARQNNESATFPVAITKTDGNAISTSEATHLSAVDDQGYTVVEQSSDFIDSYKLLQKIGQGGMGNVWMAEQYEPVRRKVAVKVIREDLGSPLDVARFEAERQAVAMMDHQNIARIFDAGTTPSGNPYFVMELVNGVPLNQYCDANQLTVRERLQLMVPVCRAIQHAHQKGIIHRDLKHSNVLVTQYDGIPVPKVIDFGLAKSLGQHQQLTDKTMFTEFGKVVGTLQYMSPEQASLDGVDVDTRCDIYALGIMIYKLLTGRTPLAGSVLKSSSLLQTLQLIREQDAPRPSHWLSSSADSLSAIAEQRRTTPDKIRLEVKGDLDWIVMKALEKDRNRRYETANGLALDIERFLADEEVRARPPSASYRLSKFVKRNRRMVGTLVISTVLLLAGIVGTSAGLLWALNERTRANQSAENAAEQARKANVAEQEARMAELKHRSLKTHAEKQLHAIQSKSAWSEWQLGNVESAWKMVRSTNADLDGWENQFLRTEFSTSEKVLYGHSMKVTCVNVAANGQFFATAATDHSIKIWDANSHSLIHTFQTKDMPTCISVSPDSKTIAAGDRANRVTLWDVDSGNLIMQSAVFSKDVSCLTFDDSGKVLWVGETAQDSYRKGNRRLKKAPSVPEIHRIDLDSGISSSFDSKHANGITGLATATNGEIISSSEDGSIQVWEWQKDRLQLLRKIDQNTVVNDIDVSPDGKLLVSCSQDSTVKLWDLNKAQLLKTFVGHFDAVHGVRFSSSGTKVVSASSDHTARVWNLSGKQIQLLQGHFDALNVAAFSTDDSELITVSDDQTIRVWDGSGSQRTMAVKVHEDVVWDAAFSSDGRRLASVGEAGLVSVVDLENDGQAIASIKHDFAILSVAWSPVADVFATGGADGKLRIHDGKNGQLLKLVDAHNDFIWDLSFSADGSLLATASSDKTGKIWNTGDWSVIKTLDDHQGELGSARFSADGKYLVTSSDDGTIMLWENGSFRKLHAFEGHRNAVWRAVFSPNSKLIASSGSDGEIYLWDLATREKIWSIKAHSNQIAGLIFSKDSRRLFSASDDQTTKVWDVESGLEMFLLRDRDDSQAVHVGLSRDGSKLVTANGEGWITIRHADDNSVDLDPFLPNDAIELTIDGLLIATSGTATANDYERLLGEAEKCCRHYPNYRNWTVAGVCLFRLNRMGAAIEALEKAQRLEPIEYGEPDVRPDIEAYLAMAYKTVGESRMANEARAVFDRKSRISLWLDDELVVALREEVKKVFDENLDLVGAKKD